MTVTEIDSVIIPVINSFNGKVYNAKLKNAIQDKLPENVYIHFNDFDYRHCRIDLSFYGKYREIYVKEKYYGEEKEHNQVYYLPQYWEDVAICYIWTDFNTWDNTKKNNEKYYNPKLTDAHFYIDDNYKMRINSSVIVSKLTEKKDAIIEDIASLEKIKTENLPDTWKNELKELKSDIEKLHHKIPSVIRDICKIASYATWQ